MTATVLREIRASEQVGSVDLVERLIESLDDVSAVRSAALLSGQSSTLLRAATATQSIIGTLIDRLGIENTEVSRLLRNGETIASAVGRATRYDPDLGRRIAAEIRDMGDEETANALDELAGLTESTTRIDEGAS